MAGLSKTGLVDALADNGWTALHQATWEDSSTAVQRLLQQGADPNQTDDEGETPLHHAAWCGHIDVARILLDKAADPNAKDGTGQTPLHKAASNGSKTVVPLLLDKGGNPRIEDSDGRKPHSLAEENFYHSTAKILRERETKDYGQEVFPDIENMPKTSKPGSLLDSAVVAALHGDPRTASVEPYGQAGSSTPSKVTTYEEGKRRTYFMKTGPDEAMFTGEFESLKAIHAAVPSLVPEPIAHGKLADSTNHYLLTEFIDMGATSDGHSSGLSLAQKLAKLHSTPAPIPEGFDRPSFGFHVPTSLGRTLQDNTWNCSWAEFYSEHRLQAICKIIERTRGMDNELRSLLDQVVKQVVPRILGDGHLGAEKGIQPALVHGDLWSGNKCRGRIGEKGGVEDVTFDAGSSYAHSEFELGIMRMFGGFSSGFFREYHRLIPKTQPESEYDDRITLYQL